MCLVEQKGQSLKQFSSRLSKTANIVAFANARNSHKSDHLVHLSSQVIEAKFATSNLNKVVHCI
jgi:hypothetical protein